MSAPIWARLSRGKKSYVTLIAKFAIHRQRELRPAAAAKGGGRMSEDADYFLRACACTSNKCSHRVLPGLLPNPRHTPHPRSRHSRTAAVLPQLRRQPDLHRGDRYGSRRRGRGHQHPGQSSLIALRPQGGTVVPMAGTGTDRQSARWWTAGVRPVVLAYLRGELTDDQLVAALRAFPYVRVNVRRPMFSAGWAEEFAHNSAAADTFQEVARWVMDGAIPYAAYRQVCRDLDRLPMPQSYAGIVVDHFHPAEGVA
jgi:hypothetical protein